MKKFIKPECMDKLKLEFIGFSDEENKPSFKKLNKNTNWIIDTSKQFIRYIKNGNFIVCSIPTNINIDSNSNSNSQDLVKQVKKHKKRVFLHTKYKKWLELTSHRKYTVEVKDKGQDFGTHNVWICKQHSFDEILKLMALIQELKLSLF